MVKISNIAVFESVLKCIQEWIRSADQKISIFLAFQGVVLTIIVQKIIEWANKNFISFSPLPLFLILSGIFLIGYSILKSAFALAPRLKRKTDKNSLIYFGDIPKFSLAEYTKQMINMTHEEYITELLEQIYTSSKISSAKHHQFKDSVYFFLLGIGILFVGYAIFWLERIYGGK